MVAAAGRAPQRAVDALERLGHLRPLATYEWCARHWLAAAIMVAVVLAARAAVVVWDAAVWDDREERARERARKAERKAQLRRWYGAGWRREWRRSGR